jgi:hypothetical protein
MLVILLLAADCPVGCKIVAAVAVGRTYVFLMLSVEQIACAVHSHISLADYS